tara:strand:+ start:850 stop:1950 length:1101 start_codon:yes stop_codon:yes gene_type:complete
MIRSLQIIDTLRIGGAERMAINIANGLSSANVESHICATRSEGQLKASIKKEVSYLFLNKKSTIDIIALFRLKKYIKKNQINILHAHGTSFFIAAIVSVFNRKLKIIWHDHYGNRVNDTNKFKLVILKLCLYNFNIIYCVNHELRNWAIENLNCKTVKFISNFPTINHKKETILNGNTGKRILCAANLREPKNHELLFKAFKKLKEECSDWSLHCIGAIYDDDYSQNLESFINKHKLKNQIFLYGAKEDVSNIISQSDIGVLTSKFEGLPMALLEYGLGKLAVLATDVGYCNKLILDDSLGVLVSSNDKKSVYNGLKLLINDIKYRKECAENFHLKILNEFSEEEILRKLILDYELLLVPDNIEKE